MRKRVSVFLYRSAHLKSPRGVREWSFVVGDGAGRVYTDAPVFTSEKMLYGEACRIALLRFQAYSSVYVLP